MRMYCITIYNDHYEKIKQLGYIPVGLGKDINSQKFVSDNTGTNISDKNSYYGEYSFHYWIWKNEIKNLKDNEWIGFCQYRKFWSINNKNLKTENIIALKKNLIKNIPDRYNQFDTILGEPLFINQFKFSKFIKKNLLKVLGNPILLFDKNKRNIKFHFDLMHGNSGECVS